MALVSPGVEVNVIDESFYTPAQAGTTPMIFVATAQDKTNSSGTGIADATRKNNAGTPYLLTSQRELADLFGDPVFETDANNNPVHAGELNEYGLQAAYSVLGVSNSAYVARADIDLSELQPSADAPAADPEDGTYWLDTDNTEFGVFEWNAAPATQPNGQTFQSRTPIVITDETQLTTGNTTDNGTDAQIPKGTVGSVGDYAVVFASTVARLFYRTTDGTWVLVGSGAWIASWPTITTDTVDADTVPEGSFDINGITVSVAENSTAEQIATAINDVTPNISGVNAAARDGAVEITTTGESTGEDSTTVTGEIVIDAVDEGLSEAIGLEDGTYYAPALQISRHTNVPRFKNSDPESRPTGSVWIKTTEPGGGADWSIKVYNSTTEEWEQVDAPLYATNSEALFELDRTGGGTNIGANAVYVQTNVANDDSPLATFKVYKRDGTAPTRIVGDNSDVELADGGEITVEATQPAQTGFVSVQINLSDGDGTEEFVSNINSAGITGLSATVDALGRAVIEHATGGDIRFTDPDSILDDLGFSAATDNLYTAPGDGDLQASLWNPTNGNGNSFYTASDSEVTSLTADGRLWYSGVVDEVDLMIHDGTNWVGYRSSTSPYASGTGAPIVAASEPSTDDLSDGDVWIDTSDIDNYPEIYRWNADLESWTLLDNTDQTSEDGVLFADARYNTSGENSGEAGDIDDLLASDYVDPDAPDPALYPRGMVLWNTRRSGFNVKRFERNYIDLQGENARQDDESMSSYYPHRWVTESRNQRDGSGSFGRKAQRQVVVQALQAEINSNDAIRDTESRTFNLIAAPGYPELIGEMVTLNYDRDLTGFVVGDVPARLTPDATTLNDWASNVRQAVEDNINGLVTRDEYLGVFYPWGFTSDNFGNNVVVPPSHMILRTILLSDQVSYPWFAPAGTRRGGITNATAVGYVDSEGEFVSIALNQGQRDVLYENNVNPITFLSGAGLVNYGQKTRARGASALDRINVARLTVFMRTQLNQLAKPYIFEQNDKITRDEIKQAVESLMLELVGQRALNDFLVVCDESNNTPARIDRNELYVDIAIEPVKAVEFIYIPLRLKNTGEIASL